MRIISQDGTLDIPYEQVVIQRFNGEIYFLNKNLIGVEQLCGDMVIAKYSTEEKQRKLWKCLENSTKNTLELLLIYMDVFSFRQRKNWSSL